METGNENNKEAPCWQISRPLPIMQMLISLVHAL